VNSVQLRDYAWFLFLAMLREKKKKEEERHIVLKEER